ncbi:hypothetical protein BDZ94DRAFT_1265507 [Collybia nuda]|uniref:Uncharacterized protein n=1 Tax=Collybia nuda TaxID=64659 RepID=A0A9P5Y1J7_9AGAR|nr:hypothetical protein BDZ94DRAFT_1265507 [Collybia nuda]
MIPVIPHGIKGRCSPTISLSSNSASFLKSIVEAMPNRKHHQRKLLMILCWPVPYFEFSTIAFAALLP